MARWNGRVVKNTLDSLKRINSMVMALLNIKMEQSIKDGLLKANSMELEL